MGHLFHQTLKGSSRNLTEKGGEKDNCSGLPIGFTTRENFNI